MSYVTADIRNLADTLSKKPVADASRKGFWSKVLETLMESRRRAAEREIARYIELNGGVMTDSIDRQIEDRFVFPGR